jgi:outer membrane usher protein FimD/PapC
MMRRRDGRAAVERVRRACGFAACVTALGLVAFASAAATFEPTLVAALGSAGPETMVVQITLNGERKGQFFVNVINGAFLARAQDLKAIGLVGAHGQTWTQGGVEFVWVASIEGIQATFDEARLSLDLAADPKLMPVSNVDLWSGRGETVVYPDNASAFFNYDVGYAAGNSGFPNGVLATTQIGARSGDFLFLSDSTCNSGLTDHKCVRLNTSLIHDRRDTLVRATVGDFAAASGSLGALSNMGGLSYSKLYDIDPYFIRYPQQNLTGQLRTPSQVDLYIDGQLVKTLRLPAGDFDLRNITQATGRRNVEVVIHDAFGRVQRLDTSFYSSENSLKAGLHEYSYNVGALRENFGVESNDYGPLAFAGFHRYGVSDTLTLGVRAEGKSGLVNAGPTATIVLGAVGILNVAGAVSESGGRTGGAGLVSYSYLGQHFNAGVLVRKDSPNYAALVDSGPDRRNYEAAATIGYTASGWGSLNVGVAAFKAYQGQDSKFMSVSYSRSVLNGRGNVFVTVVDERARDRQTNVFAGFSYNFDAEYSLIGNYQRLHGESSESLQFQKAQPVGEGLGYVIGVSQMSSPERSSTQFTPSFQYNGRWGIVRGYAQQGTGSGAASSQALSVAGGIAWAGGMIAAGRPVTDSFGVVKVGDVEGVRVLVNSEAIGRTGADGRLFVPSLSSFLNNQISIDSANVPLDITFPESVRVVSPPYRGGAVVNFLAKRLRAFVGTFKIRANGQVRPAEFFNVTLDVDGKPFTFVTGRGGEFYVEDLKSGTYKARMSANGERCDFELLVRDAQGPVTDLGETVCQLPGDPVVSTRRVR